MHFLQYLTDNLFSRTLKKRIEFISTVEGFPEVIPPVPSFKAFPDWFSKLPSSIEGNGNKCFNDKRVSTIKRCSGILDYISIGYTLPLWTDLVIRYDSSKGELACETSAPWAKVLVNQDKQFENTSLKSLIEPYKNIIKLESPWRVKLSRGCSSLIIDPFYYESSSVFTVIPGIVDHDSFYVANVFVKWNLYGKGEYYLKKGTPICKIIPFSRLNFSSEVRNATDLDRYEEKVEGIKLDSFEGTYKKFFWSKKKDFR